MMMTSHKMKDHLTTHLHSSSEQFDVMVASVDVPLHMGQREEGGQLSMMTETPRTVKLDNIDAKEAMC